MGQITSRLSLDSLHPSGRQRSHQGEEQLYSYSLNKNYFSNYFLMGGERFEVNDPDYLFGDSCDLNFLTCTKPYALPYKKAQQNLLTSLNTKQKAINKVSSRVSSLSSPLNMLTGRHRQVSQSRKQDAQTQTLGNGKGLANGPEPSQPLVMLINIRKETLRLVKSTHVCNLDSDQNSLTNTVSASNTTSEQSVSQQQASGCRSDPNTSSARHIRSQNKSSSINRHSTASSHATTVHPQDLGGEGIELEQTVYRAKSYHDSDTSSMTSNTFSSTTTSSSTGKSGYTSVKDVPPSASSSDEDEDDDDDDDDGEYFEDALNEPTNVSTDNDSEKNQQKSLLRPTEADQKDTCDIKITIDGEDEVDRHSTCDIDRDPSASGMRYKAETITDANGAPEIKARKILTKTKSRRSTKSADRKNLSANDQQASSNRVYNIEFTFDAEVDCSIRVSYFCTRVVSSNNVTYKPLHATYKSKTYTYKRGLNQKFEQQEHSFRPYLFDEDLLIYKPLDLDGNYNSGAVFPIVIHCVALEGPMPRQSQSLVATVEKSQLDDSYSIKPLKQMIFVDGVQYILQDIYGIENKPLTSSRGPPRRTARLNRNLNSSCASLYSLSNNLHSSNMNLSDTASIGSLADGSSLGNAANRGSLVSNQYRSLASENTFECVICMSDERDTMLLPCRHMCLCSSCAQSLRYQSSACPICRCPFKAALNLRFARRGNDRKWSSGGAAINSVETERKCLTSATVAPTTVADATLAKSATGSGSSKRNSEHHESSTTAATARRESLSNSATPLLARSKHFDSDKEAAAPSKRTSASHEADANPGSEQAPTAAAAEARRGESSSGAKTSSDATDGLEMRSMGKSSWSGATNKTGGATAAVLAERAEDCASAPASADDTALAQQDSNKCSSQERS